MQDPFPEVDGRGFTRLRDAGIRVDDEPHRDGVRVAVFPECALTRYSKDTVVNANQEAVAAAEEKIRMVCRQKKIATIFGSKFGICGALSAFPGEVFSPASSEVRTPIGSMAKSTIHQMTK